MTEATDRDTRPEVDPDESADADGVDVESLEPADSVEWVDSADAAERARLRMDRYGQSTAMLGVTTMLVSVGVAGSVFFVLQSGSVLALSSVALATASTVLLGLVVYLLCRSWFQQAWEERSKVLDAAAADVLVESVQSGRGASLDGDTARELVEDVVASFRDEFAERQDLRDEAIRNETLRELGRVRVFFESMLEKHVFRINRDLREREAEVEQLRLVKESSPGSNLEELEAARGEIETLRGQVAELEEELDLVDRDRRDKEKALEELRARKGSNEESSEVDRTEDSPELELADS